MNKHRDFHKKSDGVVINTNRNDFRRARNRNFVRKEQHKMIGASGTVAILAEKVERMSAMEKEIKELKKLIHEIKFDSDKKKAHDRRTRLYTDTGGEE